MLLVTIRVGKVIWMLLLRRMNILVRLNVMVHWLMVLCLFSCVVLMMLVFEI